MPTYWDAFLSEFEEETKDVPLNKILEAFFYYYKFDDIEKTKEILNVSNRLKNNMPKIAEDKLR